jgi:uncharacterized protein YprB with RNaseH-like and TPR domain
MVMVVYFDIETTGLNAYKHQIVLIGMKKGERIKQWKLWKVKDEAKMILKCIDTLRKIDSYEETIVGYNNLKFDVPFIIARLTVLNKMTPEVWNMLHNKKWFDLYQFLGNDFRSLQLWLNKFGIKRSREDIMGEQVPILYTRKEYEKIKQHNIDDLNTSEELYNKLEKKFPELLKRF